MGTQGKAAGTSRISTTISECRQYEGADYLKLGRFATGALKGVIRVAGIDDPDVSEAVGLLSDIRGLTVFSYDDCSEEDKASINLKLTDALSDSDVLMETSDSGEKVKI